MSTGTYEPTLKADATDHKEISIGHKSGAAAEVIDFRGSYEDYLEGAVLAAA
jgi:hypothetical protein